MLFANIPRYTRQNAITESDLECILARNCESTEQLQNNHIWLIVTYIHNHEKCFFSSLQLSDA